jgi:hypothetical protein
MIAGAGVNLCVYGHIHGLIAGAPIAGAACELDGTRYLLTAADYLDFTLKEIAECRKCFLPSKLIAASQLPSRDCC